MKFYIEGLSRQQRELLPQVGDFAKPFGFYLGGGTALAIYFAHRSSLDLDWFTNHPIPDALHLARLIQDADLPFEPLQIAAGTLHGRMSGVRVSFFEFRYPLLQPCTRWDEGNCDLASLDDLSCMKLAAIAQRGSRKDFVDIHALISNHRPLPELLDLYRRKFRLTDISSVLYGLVYFKDADHEPKLSMLWKISWSQVKKDISRWVKEYASID